MLQLGAVGVALACLGLMGSVLGALGPSQQHHRHVEVISFSSSLGLNYPPPVVFPAQQTTHNGTIICLHGLGDTANGWANHGREWAEKLPYIRFVFPTAPLRPISLNRGATTTGWYDLTTLDVMDHPEDEAGLRETARYVDALVEKEIADGISSDRIVIAGFSQGGAAALMALRSGHALAGVVAMSTYLPLATQAPEMSPANQDTPVLMTHGDADNVIAFRYGERSYGILRTARANVHFMRDPGSRHFTSHQVMETVEAFFQDVLGGPAPSS